MRRRLKGSKFSPYSQVRQARLHKAVIGNVTICSRVAVKRCALHQPQFISQAESAPPNVMARPLNPNH
jgi:hypothetical protein